MSRLRVAPIVEGHGEVAAVRILLERIWYEIVGGEYIDVLTPIRRKRNRLVANIDQDLEKSVRLAVAKLANPHSAPSRELVLVLVDADEDPPCQLGPQILRQGNTARNDQDIACVLANNEYETWFVAAAESLTRFFAFEPTSVPQDPETERSGKAWIKRHMPRYSETIDQPKLTSAMDLTLCRSRSASFDKLCRDLEARGPA